jgi:phage portal protein BeeE
MTSFVLCLLLGQDLAQVKRIFIDKLTPGEGSEQIRDQLLSAVASTGLFVMTENPDRADAFLRGGAEDRVYMETFDFRDGVNGRAQLGTGTTSRTSSRTAAAVSLGEDESARQTERKHEAFAAIRLVNKDGDVIWSTLQQSAGAKFRAASLDVVYKVVDQLKQDVAAARKTPAPVNAGK